MCIFANAGTAPMNALSAVDWAFFRVTKGPRLQPASFSTMTRSAGISSCQWFQGMWRAQASKRNGLEKLSVYWKFKFIAQGRQQVRMLKQSTALPIV